MRCKGNAEMVAINQLGSKSTILITAFFTVVLTSIILIFLSQLGLIAFTGAGWIVNALNMLSDYLGHSIFFFIPVFLGYGIFFVLLKTSLCRSHSNSGEMENIRFYHTGTEIFITLSFAIGVLFTAWGLQNALVSALGGLSEEEAGRLGAWGILNQLVDNGFLIAFWTTIVGGTCGYLMRLIKFLSMGRELGRLVDQRRQNERAELFEILNAIKHHMEGIEQNTDQTS